MTHPSRTTPRASAGRRPASAPTGAARMMSASNDIAMDHEDEDDEEEFDDEDEDLAATARARPTRPQRLPRQAVRHDSITRSLRETADAASHQLSATPRALEAFRPLLETQVQMMRLWAATWPRLPTLAMALPWSPARLWFNEERQDSAHFADEGDTYALALRITPSEAERVSVRCGSTEVEVDLGGPLFMGPLGRTPQRVEIPDDGDIDELRATYDGEALILRMPKLEDAAPRRTRLEH